MVFVLASCKTETESSLNQDSTSGTGTGGAPTKKEIPSLDTLTAENFRKGLKSVANKFLGRAPTLEEYTRVEAGLTAYRAVVSEYMQADQFRDKMLSYHKNYFEMGDKVEDGINYNEPANMAAYLIINDMDFREILKGRYCVDDNLQQTNCNSFANVADQNDNAAGVVTTRVFLKHWVSAFNFRRGRQVLMKFACRDYPDVTDEGLKLSEIANEIKTFDCNASNICEPRCYSCHRALNPKAALFYTYDTNGNFNPTPADDVATLTDTSEVSTISHILKDGAVPSYQGKPVSKLNEYTDMLADSLLFRDCMAKRFTQFMFGETDNLKEIAYNLQYLKLSVQEHDYKVKPLLLDIVSSYEFLK
jgi:hypothetical protein